jgi:hypothetical protein
MEPPLVIDVLAHIIISGLSSQVLTLGCLNRTSASTGAMGGMWNGPLECRSLKSYLRPKDSLLWPRTDFSLS